MQSFEIGFGCTAFLYPVVVLSIFTDLGRAKFGLVTIPLVAQG